MFLVIHPKSVRHLELPRDVYSQLSGYTLWLNNQLISSSNSYRSTTTTSGYCVEFINDIYIFLWRCGPTRARASSFMRFLDHTQRRTTVDRTPLDEWSACRRGLYLTTHNTHNRQISMPLAGFEPTISAGERPQAYALDRAPTGIGIINDITCTFIVTTQLMCRKWIN